MARRLCVRCTLTFVSILLTLTSVLWAQMPVSTSTTSTPVPGAGHDYLGDLNETVNPVNGSLSIRINTPMPPGRGVHTALFICLRLKWGQLRHYGFERKLRMEDAIANCKFATRLEQQRACSQCKRLSLESTVFRRRLSPVPLSAGTAGASPT